VVNSYATLLSLFFFFCAKQPKLGLGCLTVEVSRSHTGKHTHLDPLNEWSAHHRGHYLHLLHNTQQTQEENIHTLSRIQTCDPSLQVAADVCLRPDGCFRWVNNCRVWFWMGERSRRVWNSRTGQFPVHNTWLPPLQTTDQEMIPLGCGHVWQSVGDCWTTVDKSDRPTTAHILTTWSISGSV